MKQKLFIFSFLVLMAAVLVGLNAASYTQKEKTPNVEFSPNRSTFNAGATGTQAFYSLLSETGRKAVRWHEPPAALLTSITKNKPAVFVVTGTIKRQFTPPEVEGLLRWVSNGGRLVLIDRDPPEELVMTTANWKISFSPVQLAQADPGDQKQMTGETAAAKPIQPSVLTANVNAIQPSRFAASIDFERYLDNTRSTEEAPPPRAISQINRNASDPKTSNRTTTRNDRLYEFPSPTPVEVRPLSTDDIELPSQFAPVVHFSSGNKNLVVDAPFGSGRIVYLSDPYIVSNGGIALVDNAQLAINLVAADGRIVAFDEYHQGYGKDGNRLLQFFAGTPIVSIFLQAGILIAFVFFSQSRRFARPVPEAEPDRLSKLEYVAAMAELQARTSAYDLAIENIYNEFRRRMARFFGLDNYLAKTSEIAALIAERAGLDKPGVLKTLHQCEEIIRGEPTNKREVLRLVEALRSMEQKLGMTRAGRKSV